MASILDDYSVMSLCLFHGSTACLWCSWPYVKRSRGRRVDAPPPCVSVSAAHGLKVHAVQLMMTML